MTGPSTSLPLLPPGHGKPRGPSPFAAAFPSILAAVGYALALLVWLAFGDVLPGGRAFAVHLFTLGVLTNLVLTFSEHFTRTVTRTPGERAWWWPIVTNVAILLVLVGLPTRIVPVLGAGATLLIGVVFLAYLRLRRMRKAAIGARFGWIARVYERAHGAFIHGAVFGALMGVGLVAGTWYGATRVAHLHANVLGWGGLTLLATLVFFGPSMARTRIEPGADARAAVALKHGATGLSVAIVLLFVTGFGGVWATALQVVAAGGLAVYAVATVRVCLPVMRAVWDARGTAPRPLLLALCLWFVLVVWLDVAVVATGAWPWLDVLGIIALAGVLAQAIIATLIYLAPMLRGRTTGDREAMRVRLETGLWTRTAVLNLGVVLAALGATRPLSGTPLLGLGWLLVGAVVVVTLATVLWPLRAQEPVTAS